MPHNMYDSGKDYISKQLTCQARETLFTYLFVLIFRKNTVNPCVIVYYGYSKNSFTAVIQSTFYMHKFVFLLNRFSYILLFLYTALTLLCRMRILRFLYKSFLFTVLKFT